MNEPLAVTDDDLHSAWHVSYTFDVAGFEYVASPYDPRDVFQEKLWEALRRVLANDRARVIARTANV